MEVALVTVCVSWCSPLCSDGSVVFFLFCSQRTVKIASCEISMVSVRRSATRHAGYGVVRLERLLSSQFCGLAGNGGIISLKVRTRLQDFAWSLSHVLGISVRRFAGSPEAAV